MVLDGFEEELLRRFKGWLERNKDEKEVDRWCCRSMKARRPFLRVVLRRVPLHTDTSRRLPYVEILSSSSRNLIIFSHLRKSSVSLALSPLVPSLDLRFLPLRRQFLR